MAQEPIRHDDVLRTQARDKAGSSGVTQAPVDPVPELRSYAEALALALEQGVDLDRGQALKDRRPRRLTSRCLGGDIAAKTSRGQPSGSSVFERLSSVEIDALFEREGERLRVRPQFRNGIDWRLGDAGAPSLVPSLGPQDVVVANRFLCHMNPEAAEACLRNLSRLVRSGGYLFISGVDLPVRTKVALECGWLPVTDLIEEIHEGDPSLRRDWPLQYWGLEPFDRGRDDWNVRYASVFQLKGHAQSARSTAS